MAHLLVEGPELNQSVAHHVGVGGQSRAYLIHGVACHLIPILAVAVDHLQAAAVLGCHGSSHLEVLLARAVPFGLFLGTDFDVETIGMQSEACKLIDDHRTVYAAREQHRNALVC